MAGGAAEGAGGGGARIVGARVRGGPPPLPAPQKPHMAKWCKKQHLRGSFVFIMMKIRSLGSLCLLPVRVQGCVY